MRSYVRVPRRAWTRRPGMRRAAVLAVLAGALVLVGSSGLALADNGPPGVAIPYGSTYDALINPATGPTAPDWYSAGYDETGWTLGAHAPFGYGTACTQNSTQQTLFPLGSTIYLRKSFPLPANAFGLHVVGTIDNYADTYVNGSYHDYTSSGSCATGAISFDVPASSLNPGGDNLVAVKARDDGSTASFFDMQATYGALQFGAQPTETQKGSAIAPSPTVTITPAAGGAAIPDGTQVQVSLQTIAGTGTLSGTTTATTTSGVATFSNLVVSGAGEYRLVATSEGATATSDPFLVADQITPCSGTCSASGSDSGTTVDASASNAGSSSLAVSVYSGASPPAGVCGDFSPLGAISVVNVLDTGSSQPNFELTWTLDKSLVMQAGNPGAAHFNICLGAEDLAHPDGTGATPWTTKDGTPATPQPDPVNSHVTLFWGLLPDCPKKGTATGPCILHRNKNKGNEVIDIFKPYPWDGRMLGG